MKPVAPSGEQNEPERTALRTVGATDVGVVGVGVDGGAVVGGGEVGGAVADGAVDGVVTARMGGAVVGAGDGAAVVTPAAEVGGRVLRTVAAGAVPLDAGSRTADVTLVLPTAGAAGDGLTAAPGPGVATSGAAARVELVAELASVSPPDPPITATASPSTASAPIPTRATRARPLRSRRGVSSRTRSLGRGNGTVAGKAAAGTGPISGWRIVRLVCGGVGGPDGADGVGVGGAGFASGPGTGMRI